MSHVRHCRECFFGTKKDRSATGKKTPRKYNILVTVRIGCLTVVSKIGRINFMDVVEDTLSLRCTPATSYASVSRYLFFDLLAFSEGDRIFRVVHDLQDIDVSG